MSFFDFVVIVLGVSGLIVFFAAIDSLYRKPFHGSMSREERDFAEDAYRLHMKGTETNKSKTAFQALSEYEALHDAVASGRKLRSEHIYQEDLDDIRYNYETLARDEWEKKAGKILDRFYEKYRMITDPSFRDVEKAYTSKKSCIKDWQDFFYSIPSGTGIWYDGKAFMKEYLGENYDDCMFTHESLDKKLSQCIEEMKPEYQRKMKLRQKIVDIVAENESIMRSKLVSMPFEGCTSQEVLYCIKELVEKYRLVSTKIGNRYFISLSDKEKAKRTKGSHDGS